MFGGEVTMYLPVQQHSLVARCATYFTLHHNQYFPSSIMCLLLRFIMVITTKSPRIFCASKKCFCEHPAIHVICFYTKDVFRFQAIARLQELSHARKSLTSATGYDINPKVSLS